MKDIDVYTIEIEQAREERLISNPLNWFSLAGLFPLADGINRLGKSEEFDITLPALPQDARAEFEVRGDDVYLTSASAGFTINGQPPTVDQLRKDIDGDPDLVENASIAIRVIQRNGRPYLRVWDRESSALKNFSGLRYFTVDPVHCVEGEFVPYDPPRAIRIADAIGGEHEILFPGEARFTLRGVACVLVAEYDEDELLFNFTDLTRADATYPGGRYLLTEKPVGNHITLDFNLTRNWPCAYTQFATCPLPPTENHLMVRVEAGEKRYYH